MINLNFALEVFDLACEKYYDNIDKLELIYETLYNELDSTERDKFMLEAKNGKEKGIDNQVVRFYQHLFKVISQPNEFHNSWLASINDSSKNIIEITNTNLINKINKNIDYFIINGINKAISEFKLHNDKKAIEYINHVYIPDEIKSIDFIIDKNKYVKFILDNLQEYNRSYIEDSIRKFFR